MARESSSTIRTKRVYNRKPKVPNHLEEIVTQNSAPTPQELAAQAVGRSLSTTLGRIVSVQFAGSQQLYAYHTHDQSIGEGDFCIVISPMNDRNLDNRHYSPEAKGYPTIVRVHSVKETVDAVNKASKWIVSKVDLTQAIADQERREAIAVLDAKIERARKAAEQQIQLDQLRALSPELNELINQRESIA